MQLLLIRNEKLMVGEERPERVSHRPFFGPIMIQI